MDRDEPVEFVEAAMFMAVTGVRAGHYVARCARDICGYEANLESGFSYRGSLLQRYPIRGPYRLQWFHSTTTLIKMS